MCGLPHSPGTLLTLVAAPFLGTSAPSATTAGVRVCAGQDQLKSLCSWGHQVSDNVEHGAHSLADWSDTMSAPYLHADTHWTLIEIHWPRLVWNFKQLLGLVLSIAYCVLNLFQRGF